MVSDTCNELCMHPESAYDINDLCNAKSSETVMAEIIKLRWVYDKNILLKEQQIYKAEENLNPQDFESMKDKRIQLIRDLKQGNNTLPPSTNADCRISIANCLITATHIAHSLSLVSDKCEEIQKELIYGRDVKELLDDLCTQLRKPPATPDAAGDDSESYSDDFENDDGEEGYSDDFEKDDGEEGAKEEKRMPEVSDGKARYRAADESGAPLKFLGPITDTESVENVLKSIGKGEVRKPREATRASNTAEPERTLDELLEDIMPPDREAEQTLAMNIPKATGAAKQQMLKRLQNLQNVTCPSCKGSRHRKHMGDGGCLKAKQPYTGMRTINGPITKRALQRAAVACIRHVDGVQIVNSAGKTVTLTPTRAANIAKQIYNTQSTAGFKKFKQAHSIPNSIEYTANYNIAGAIRRA